MENIKFKTELSEYLNNSLEPFDKEEINKTLILSLLRDFEKYADLNLVGGSK